MSKRLIPLLDRVLVRKLKAPEQSLGGILLPETAAKLNEGTVVAVGAGARNAAGDLIPNTVKEGDTVMLPEYGGQQVIIDSDKCFLASNILNPVYEVMKWLSQVDDLQTGGYLGHPHAVTPSIFSHLDPAVESMV